jgi:hypothetical protein
MGDEFPGKIEYSTQQAIKNNTFKNSNTLGKIENSTQQAIKNNTFKNSNTFARAVIALVGRNADQTVQACAIQINHDAPGTIGSNPISSTS